MNNSVATRWFQLWGKLNKVTWAKLFRRTGRLKLAIHHNSERRRNQTSLSSMCGNMKQSEDGSICDLKTRVISSWADSSGRDQLCQADNENQAVLFSFSFCGLMAGSAVMMKGSKMLSVFSKSRKKVEHQTQWQVLLHRLKKYHKLAFYQVYLIFLFIYFWNIVILPALLSPSNMNWYIPVASNCKWLISQVQVRHIQPCSLQAVPLVHRHLIVSAVVKL